MRGNRKIPDGGGKDESVCRLDTLLETAEIIFGCALGMVVLECEVLDLQILEPNLHNLCIGECRADALQECFTQNIGVTGIVGTGDERKYFHEGSLSPLTISPLTIRNSLSRSSECAVIVFLAFLLIVRSPQRTCHRGSFFEDDRRIIFCNTEI